jgi:hypothetical protein
MEIVNCNDENEEGFISIASGRIYNLFEKNKFLNFKKAPKKINKVNNKCFIITYNYLITKKTSVPFCSFSSGVHFLVSAS